MMFKKSSLAVLVWLMFPVFSGYPQEEKNGPVLARLGSSLWKQGGRITALAYSPEGTLLASAGQRDGIRIRDARTGQQRLHLQWDKPSSACLHLAFSPDSSLLAGGFLDGTVRIWNPGSGEEIRTLDRHAGWLRGLSFSPDGRTLYSMGGDDNEVRAWNIGDWRLRDSFRAGEHRIREAVFSRDGERLVLEAGESGIFLWDLEEKREISRFFEPRIGQLQKFLAVAASPDGKTIAACDTDRLVTLWEAQSGRKLLEQTAPEIVPRLLFSPDGSRLALSLRDGSTVLWSVPDGGIAAQLEVPPGAGEGIHSNGPAAFSPDGKMLALGTVLHTVERWDVETGKRIPIEGNGHYGPVQTLRFDPEGDRLIARGAGERFERVWDLSNRRETGRLPLEEEPDTGTDRFARTEDGQIEAFYSLFDTVDAVRIWKEKSGGAQLHLPPNSRVDGFLFSRDGGILAARGGPWTSQVFLWELATGKRICEIPKPRPIPLSSLAFSSDGARIAFGDEAGEIHLVNVGTFEGFRFHPRPEGGKVTSLAFSPSGDLLAAGLGDTTILLLNLAEFVGEEKSGDEAGGENRRKWWEGLTSGTPFTAFQALGGWETAPGSPVPFWRERLREDWKLARAESDSLAGLIDKLADPDPSNRWETTRQFQEAGERAEPVLRRMLSESGSVDLRERIRFLLEELEKQPVRSPRKLRTLRVIRGLERQGTEEACGLLEEIRRDSPWKRTRNESESALSRMQNGKS